MGDDSATEMLDKLLAEEGVPPADAAGGDEMSGDSQKLKNYADLMKKVPLLRSLTEEEQLKIAALLKPKEFEDGENIITQGEEGDCMYFIQSGEVRHAKISRRASAVRWARLGGPAASLLPPRQHTLAVSRLPQCSSHRSARSATLTPHAACNQAEAVVEGVGVVMEYGFGGFFGELALRTSAPRAATVRAKVSGSNPHHACADCAGAAHVRWAGCLGHTSRVLPLLACTQGFSSTVLELPRSAFEWLMKQKGDIKALIEQQASSYAGAGSFDVEVSATPKGNAALTEEQLRELCDSQGLEITLLKKENVELMKDLEDIRRQLAASRAEVVSLKAGGGVVAQAGDDDMDGET